MNLRISSGIQSKHTTQPAIESRIVERAMTLFAAALLAAALGGCRSEPPGVKLEASELIPRDAYFALAVDGKAVAGSPIAEMLRTASVATVSELDGIVKAAAECKVTLEQTHFLAGYVDENNFVLVVESPGLGKLDRINCLDKAARKAAGKPPVRIQYERRGPVRIAKMEDGGWLILLNENKLAITGSTLLDEVFARIERPEARERSALGKVIANADRKAGILLTAIGTEQLYSDMELPPDAGLEVLTMGLDLAAEIQAWVQLEFANEGKAKELQAQLDEALVELKDVLPSMGLDPAMADSLTTRTTGSQVDIGVTLTPKDLSTLGTLLMMEE